MLGESLQRVLLSVFELFMFLFLVATGIYFAKQTPLSDITKAYLEQACVKGGFTAQIVSDMKEQLTNNGYDPADLEITVTPAKAFFSTDTEYVKRGEIISIRIEYKKLGMLDTLYKKLGATADTKNSCIRYGMSERY